MSCDADLFASSETGALFGLLARAYSSAFAIDLKDGAFRSLRMNPRLRALLPENGSRKDFGEFIEKHAHPEDRAKLRAFIDPAFLCARLRTDDRFSFSFREVADGAERYLHAEILRDAAEDRAIAAFTDITDEICAQRENTAKIEAADTAKADFVFRMSHEIRTQLNAVKGYSILARQAAADPSRVTGYLGKIDTAGSRLLSLVNQVVEMSRLESGQTVPTEDKVNIPAEVRRIIGEVSPNAARHGVRVTGKADSIRDAYTVTDENMFYRIFFNVVGNAVKYAPEGGSVSFEVCEEPCNKRGCAAYVFTVRETGEGMRPEFLNYIYDAFAGGRTNASGVQGTGLGMAVVKRMIDLLEGEISIESLKSGGVEVTIALPMRLSDADGEEESDCSGLDFGGTRVLLAEDNEMNREIAREILTAAGFSVDEAEDGDTAVEAVKRSEPGTYAAVLMDIQMPRMNGYDAAREIRGLDDPALAGIPIIAMTADAFDEDRKNALAAGMNEYLSKPIDVNRLIRTIAKYL